MNRSVASWVIEKHNCTEKEKRIRNLLITHSGLKLEEGKWIDKKIDLNSIDTEELLIKILKAINDDKVRLYGELYSSGKFDSNDIILDNDYENIVNTNVKNLNKEVSKLLTKRPNLANVNSVREFIYQLGRTLVACNSSTQVLHSDIAYIASNYGTAQTFPQTSFGIIPTTRKTDSGTTDNENSKLSKELEKCRSDLLDFRFKNQMETQDAKLKARGELQELNLKKEGDIKELKITIKDLEKRLKNAELDAKNCNKDLNTTRSELDTCNRNLKKADEDLGNCLEDLKNSSKKSSDLKKNTTDLENRNTKLMEKTVEQNNSDLIQQIDKTQAKNTDLTKQNDQLQTELDRLYQQLSRIYIHYNENATIESYKKTNWSELFEKIKITKTKYDECSKKITELNKYKEQSDELEKLNQELFKVYYHYNENKQNKKINWTEFFEILKNTKTKYDECTKKLDESAAKEQSADLEKLNQELFKVYTHYNPNAPDKRKINWTEFFEKLKDTKTKYDECAKKMSDFDKYKKQSDELEKLNQELFKVYTHYNPNAPDKRKINWTEFFEKLKDTKTNHDECSRKLTGLDKSVAENLETAEELEKLRQELNKVYLHYNENYQVKTNINWIDLFEKIKMTKTKCDLSSKKVKDLEKTIKDLEKSVRECSGQSEEIERLQSELTSVQISLDASLEEERQLKTENITIEKKLSECEEKLSGTRGSLKVRK
ncbi:unknown [Cryptophlebia leucotreta granulovirus]|uniref:Uncharacterized protein n=1 Tax=Cryptophlebia leucotreta granulosis virus TaxID=35254 RepID=Q7T5P2_GVCL|nr:hypothetical protein [Cryptophlebia leucotreta granulovirus]AAQ21642.1 unknown [Cryptophlebia leucotreta granulovirus]